MILELEDRGNCFMFWAILNIIYYCIIPINGSIIFIRGANTIIGIDVMTMGGINISIIKRSYKFRVSLVILDCFKSNFSLFERVL